MEFLTKHQDMIDIRYSRCSMYRFTNKILKSIEIMSPLPRGSSFRVHLDGKGPDKLRIRTNLSGDFSLGETCTLTSQVGRGLVVLLPSGRTGEGVSVEPLRERERCFWAPWTVS